VSKKIQIQVKRRPPQRPGDNPDAPTVDGKIARTWFGKS
jgi:hypothetical protein